MDIQKFIDRKKIKPAKLAELLGTKQPSVSKWINKGHTPSYTTICKLIKLGMTFNEIFGNELCEIERKNNNANTNTNNLFNLQDLQKAIGEDFLNEKPTNNLTIYISLLRIWENFVPNAIQNGDLDEKLFLIHSFLIKMILEKLDKTAGEAFIKNVCHDLKKQSTTTDNNKLQKP